MSLVERPPVPLAMQAKGVHREGFGAPSGREWPAGAAHPAPNVALPSPFEANPSPFGAHPLPFGANPVPFGANPLTAEG